ncbi:hypothetical protein AMJ57_04910 [Parcubacteria bacterium SG8_24]|nr:MAG: hypothetical protein AMJ57_04910 [Parcubacteria bacterium SG8_24]
MARTLFLFLGTAFLASCSDGPANFEVGSPAEVNRLTDVSAGLVDLPPGWMRVSDEALTKDHNAVYGYARRSAPGQAMVESFIEIDVYPAETVTPRFLCHRSAEEVDGTEWRAVAVLIAPGNQACRVDLRFRGVTDFCGAIDAFYAGDDHVVHMAGTWPRDSHQQISRDYRQLVGSVVIRQ